MGDDERDLDAATRADDYREDRLDDANGRRSADRRERVAREWDESAAQIGGAQMGWGW